MTLSLPPVPHLRGPALADAPRVTRAPARAPAAARDAHWPRLLAHLSGDGVDVALERADRSLSHRRRLLLRSSDGLGAALRGWIASTGQAPAAGALVVDGPVSAGRFHARSQGRGAGIEGLRVELGLRALRVIDERSALCLATRAPAASEVRWVLGPLIPAAGAAVPTAVCRLGSDADAALLAPVGRGEPTPPLALMGHPFAPVGEDEQAVVAALRARGVAPVFANLLGTDGLSRAFEALAGIDYDNACPLPADSVVSLAARDERARRACDVVCAAIAQLCALLSFDGVRRVLLAGRAATLLAPALAQAPLMARVQAVRAGAAEPGVAMEVGVLATPVRFLDGARAALDEALRAPSVDTAPTLLGRVAQRRPQLTPQSQRVADLVLDDPRLVTRESVSAIAAAARVSPSQVSRFCRALGFGGLIEFKLELVADLARAD